MRIYQSEKITERIDLLGNMAFPVYLIKGSRNALIDSGVTICGPLILKDLEKFLGNPRELNLNLLTHSHFDHCGSSPFLKRNIPGLQIAASEVASQVFANPRAIELIRSLNADMEKGMEFPPGTNISFSGLELDTILKDGDLIDLGRGVKIEVISTPGHTRGCLSYYLRKDQALFFSEAGGVLDAEGVIQPEFLSSYSDYLKSLRKMSKYPVKIIGPAHGAVLTGKDGEGYLENSIRETKKFRERIKRELERYGDRGKVVEVIAGEDYQQGKILQGERAYRINLEAMVKVVAENR